MEVAKRLLHSEILRMRTKFAWVPADGANTQEIANAARSLWRDVDAALSPIVGQRGVDALFKRSLYLRHSDYPWLASVYADSFFRNDFAALQTALLLQTSATAAAANSALLQTFYELLAKLIGDSLTEQLLVSVLDNPHSGPAVKEASP